MKTRRMSKPEMLKALHRRMTAGAPLSADQLRGLGLCHHINLDAIATGTAAPGILWDLAESVLTWWHVARALQAGLAEMDAQADLVSRMITRYGRTGRVLFDGPDMQLARDGVGYMDQLAELVDTATAWKAAAWSQHEVERMEAAAQQMRAQQEQREGQAA